MLAFHFSKSLFSCASLKCTCCAMPLCAVNKPGYRYVAPKNGSVELPSAEICTGNTFSVGLRSQTNCTACPGALSLPLLADLKAICLARILNMYTYSCSVPELVHYACFTWHLVVFKTAYGTARQNSTQASMCADAAGGLRLQGGLDNNVNLFPSGQGALIPTTSLAGGNIDPPYLRVFVDGGDGAPAEGATNASSCREHQPLVTPMFVTVCSTGHMTSRIIVTI